MAALVARGGRVVKLVNSTTSTANIACLHTGSARLADAINQPVPWNYLWKPGPYPETEDAKLAAAKKYGLIIEDYKPYPKGDDTLAGDYPMLPLVPEAHRKALYEWDFPEYRRDYGEPLHENWDMYRETRWTPHSGQRFSLKWQVFFLVSILSVNAGLYWFCKTQIPIIQRPVLELQNVRDGPHYTFEPLD